jgi:hypothetical protein
MRSVYNGRMSEVWAGILVGFFIGIAASILANYLWDLKGRRRAHKTASKLAGTWVAYDIRGRMIDDTPMPGAGLTVVSSKPHWWATDSGVLDVRSEDVGSGGPARRHDGIIVLDATNDSLATRIDRYADSNEVAQQRLAIDADCNTVYIFPDATNSTLGDVYGRHAWRRKR